MSAVKDAIDLNLSWCLRQIDATSNAFSFSIDRASKRCRTPRRNDDVESALSFFREVAQWCTSVRAYFFYDLFQAQTNVLDTSQTGALSVVNVFVPVQPLFDNSTASRGAGGDAAAIEAVSSGAAAAAVVVKTREEGGFGMLRSTVKRIDVGAALVKLPQPSKNGFFLFSSRFACLDGRAQARARRRCCCSPTWSCCWRNRSARWARRWPSWPWPFRRRA